MKKDKKRVTAKNAFKTFATDFARLIGQSKGINISNIVLPASLFKRVEIDFQIDMTEDYLY